MRDDGPRGRPIRPSEVGVDRVLVGAVLALIAFGMVMVFSSGAVFAAKKYGDATYFLKRELVYAIARPGRDVVRACASTTRIYRRLAYPLLFVSLGAARGRADDRLAHRRRQPLVPRSGRCRSSRRELAKLALVIYLAYAARAQGREGARRSPSASCRRCW